MIDRRQLDLSNVVVADATASCGTSSCQGHQYLLLLRLRDIHSSAPALKFASHGRAIGCAFLPEDSTGPNALRSQSIPLTVSQSADLRLVPLGSKQINSRRTRCVRSPERAAYSSSDVCLRHAMVSLRAKYSQLERRKNCSIESDMWPVQASPFDRSRKAAPSMAHEMTSEIGISSVVRMLPIQLPSGDAAYLPFLFLRSPDGEACLSEEALSWALSCQPHRDLATIQRGVTTVGRFHDYCTQFLGENEVPEDDIDYIIYAYLAFRYDGSTASRANVSRRWCPATSGVVEHELRDITDFFQHCEVNFNGVRLGQRSYPFSPHKSSFQRLQDLQRRSGWDFLIHLESHRKFWEQFSQPNDPLVPPVFKRRSKHQRGGTGIVMSEEEIWEVIRRETNPAFRAVWLAGAFGGPRISEQLNFWQIDILPGSCRSELFGYTNPEVILVLKAHPTDSRYTTGLSKPGPTRRQYLLNTYNGKMLPRPETGDSRRAGFKGMIFTNEQLLLAEMFWIDDTAADLFAECVEEIQAFHRHYRTSSRHPYFYVNLADPTGDHRGDELKASNIQKRWEAACKRCDLPPRMHGRNIHGLRHFYKWYAKKVLHIPPDVLQIMLGHASIESQDDYGQAARDANASLAEALNKSTIRT